MLTDFSDGTILIRRYQHGDGGALYEAVLESFAELHQWMPWCHEEYALIDSCAWVLSRGQAWNSGEDYSFVIADAATGAFLGGVGINQIVAVDQLANLGYWVRTGSRGRGIAPRAALLTAQFGFKELKLQRLEIIAAVGNTASQRAAEKTGARKEGVLRNRIFVRGQSHDAVLYSLLPEDLAIGAI